MVTILPVIRLGGAALGQQIIPQPTIFLGKPRRKVIKLRSKTIRLRTKKQLKRAARRKKKVRQKLIKRRRRRKAVRFITSPKLTVGLATTLGTLVGGPIVGLKTFAGTGLLLGAAQVSPKFRAGIAGKITDPLAGGRFIGGLIEGTEEEVPLTFIEKIKEGFAKAGPVGAAAAVVAGVVGAGAVIRSITKGATAEDVIAGIPSISIPTASFATLPLKPQLEPISAVKKVPEPKEEVIPPTQAMPNINIKNIMKPIINIKISKSKRFINQQILVPA